MPLNSINTNVGARSALRYLGSTTADLAVTQRRVATGVRVSSVKDNSAVWAIAQKQRGEAGALDGIIAGLGRAHSIVDVAMSAGEVISDLLVKMRERALSAADRSISADALTAIDTDFKKLRDQITRVVRDAQFDGVNIVDDNAEDFDVLAGLGQETVTLPERRKTLPNGRIQVKPGGTQVINSTITVDPAYLSLGGANVVVSASATVSDQATRAALITQINTSTRNVSNALTRLGATAKALQSQQTFLTKLQANLRTGVGDLVDADLAKESAKLQALQVREQLGMQALRIANGAPDRLLGLFRG